MKKKIGAGARFFQTQSVYEPEKLERFMDRTHGFNVPVIAGIVILKSAAMARFMNKNVAGIRVPGDIIDEMEGTAKEDRRKKAVEVAARLIRQVQPFCQGVHIMPLGWDDLVPQVIKEAELSSLTTL
jgi:methylenetetrahydrofolate reductase (NADPH)